MNNHEFGALHYGTALVLVAFSVVLASLIYFGVIHAHYWVAAIPAFYAWARPSAYRLISGATYHAYHRFDSDMQDHAEATVRDDMTQAVTLDAESFLRSIRADDEKAGRA